MLREAEVVVLGAGVAGLTLARLLWERGRKVLVVAEALGEASRPPVALVNPLRGRRFTLAEEGERALAAALAFYGRFVPLHLGVFRPVPEEDRPKVAGRLSRLKHRWEKEGVLLEEAFWLEPRPLLARLAEGLPLLRGGSSPGSLPGWSSRAAGGSGGGSGLRRGWPGAHLLGLEGRHVPGLVLTLLDYFPRAVSYRVYLAGAALGGSYLPGRRATASRRPRKGRWSGFSKGPRPLWATAPGWPPFGGGAL